MSRYWRRHVKKIEFGTFIDDCPVIVHATGERLEPGSPYWACRSIRLYQRDANPYRGDVSDDDKDRIIVEGERVLEETGRVYGH